jgi:hypothetical protein
MDHKPVCRPALFTARLISATEVKKTIPFVFEDALGKAAFKEKKRAFTCVYISLLAVKNIESLRKFEA